MLQVSHYVGDSAVYPLNKAEVVATRMMQDIEVGDWVEASTIRKTRKKRNGRRVVTTTRVWVKAKVLDPLGDPACLTLENERGGKFKAGVLRVRPCDEQGRTKLNPKRLEPTKKWPFAKATRKKVQVRKKVQSKL